MKSAAIVLGLALAANAQVDNELAANLPYNPSGADLVKNAGWGRHLPIHTPPKHTNPTYWSKNDDVADDELVQTFYSPSGADLVKYAKQSQQTVYRPTAHVVRDDEVDDELMVYYTKDSRGNNHYQWGTTTNRDDATDDELMVYYTKDSQGNKHYQGGYTVRRDDVADDELVQTFYSPSGADLVKYAKQSQQTTYRPTAHVVRDDEGDDELMVYYTKDSRGNNHYQWGTTGRDDATDDELMVYYTKDSRGNNHYQWGATGRDDAADDELVSLPYRPVAHVVRPVDHVVRPVDHVVRPVAHVVRDDEDDELMVYYTKDSRGNNHYQWGTTGRDDAADDELAYLGDLIKETKPEVRRHFRHVEKN